MVGALAEEHLEAEVLRDPRHLLVDHELRVPERRRAAAEEALDPRRVGLDLPAKLRLVREEREAVVGGLAEELDADWSQMRGELAPADTALYKNLLFGVQGTGGSTAMANSYEQMRKAGAAARAMLVTAAANEWGVPAAETAASSSP